MRFSDEMKESKVPLQTLNEEKNASQTHFYMNPACSDKKLTIILNWLEKETVNSLKMEGLCMLGLMVLGAQK
jgi:hypothetical protein